MEKEKEIFHIKAESAFVPESPESKELSEKKELEFVIDPSSGKIAKIGDPRDVRDWLAAKKQENPDLVIQAQTGEVLIPAMTDAHNHLLYGALDVIDAGQLFDVENKEQMKLEILKQLQKNDPKKPQIFMGHNTVAVPDIWKKDLDEITQKPIGVWELSFHGARLNTPMMNLVIEQAEKERNVGCEVSGEIKNNGLVTEGYSVLAMQVAEACYGIEKIMEGMEGKLDDWVGRGISDIHELYPLSWTEFTALLTMRKKWRDERKTEFPVRQIFMSRVLAEELTHHRKELEAAGLFDFEKDWQIIGLKLLADGSFGSRTAMLSKSYSDIPGKGIEYDSIVELNKAIMFAKEQGIERISMHAIGDAGVRRAVQTAKKWVKAAEKAKLDPTKFRIDHFELPGAALGEVKSLGIWVNSEPNFLTDFIYEDRLSNRVMQICPHADILSNGIPMHFGSDGMPTSALFGIWSATHHPNPKQRIPFERALGAYSLMAADYEHNEQRGRIKEGAEADVIIINRETLNELLPGDASGAEFVKLGKDGGFLNDKVAKLENGIAKIYRQGKIVSRK